MPQILKAMNITKQNSFVLFSVQAGTYHNEFEVTLSADVGAEIYYTTDESYPSANNGILYTKPILIDSTTSVRAIAVSIDTDAFAYCCRLKNIYAPKLNSLLVTDLIDVGTFYRCYNLTEVKFPLVTGDIPEHCFSECVKIEKAEFDNVLVVKYKAFKDCYKLNSIYLGRSNRTICIL